MYEYIERNSDKIKKNIKAYFQNARLGLLKYDELNKSQIDEEVDKIFDNALSLNNDLLKGLINDLDYDEEDYPIKMLNDRYSKTTKYVFANELDRKRARYKENIISSMYGITDFQGKRKDFSKEAMLGALSSMAFIKIQNDTARFVAQQIEECAVDDERFMYLQEGMKEGVEYVRWVSMDDGRDCDECHELNGQIFPIDAVVDAFHWGCRCQLEYVSEEELKELEELQKEEFSETNLATPRFDNPHMDKGFESFEEAIDNTNGSKDMAMRLRVAGYEVAYEKDINSPHAYYYDLEKDKIFYNPTLKGFEKYPVDYSTVHELSHMIDYKEIKSWGNSKFIDAVDKLGNKLNKNPDIIREWFSENHKYSNNYSLSDIASAVTRGKSNHISLGGHSGDYWNEFTIYCEVFSNVATIDMLGYNREELFANELKEIYDCYKEMVKYANNIK